MKVPLNWIREFADIPMDAEAYQHRMVMAGTGVESLEDLSGGFPGVVAARVLEVREHPDSDHLKVCQVDAGGEAPLTIVCGAPNVREGLLVPAALEGAKLPNGQTIGRGTIRGVESRGMLCSAAELGIPQDLYPSVGEAGLLVLKEDVRPGTGLAETLCLDDTVADFEILANRPDCYSVLGLARETAATLGTGFREQLPKVVESGGDVEQYAQVEVRDERLCPRYMARVVRNVRLRPSPLWLRARLHAAGVRAINNVVDITNYVMLETGHPMHAFDLSQVRGRRIVVRAAEGGETLTTLDGRKHALSGGELLICDAEGPTGLAGIMGGLESEITDGTREILFECAAFDRTQTRITARGLGIRTESSGRFERGVNPATVGQAMERAMELVNLLDAGDVVAGAIDLYPHPAPPQRFAVSVARVAHRAGTDIKGSEMADILRRLFFDVTLEGDRMEVGVPAFRQDVEGEADVCEEVLRLYGYDRIPETNLRGETLPGRDSASRIQKRKVQAVLSGLGYDEIINFSFLGQRQLEMLGLPESDPRLRPIGIRNPLGEDTAVMRTTLAADMFRVLSRNMNARTPEALLYEFGTVYDGSERTPEGLYRENRALCLGGYGEGTDFYALRDAVMTLMDRFLIPCDIRPGGEPYHHPGRRADILAQGGVIARVGEAHPATAERFGMTRRAYLAEIDLEMFSRLARPFGTVKPIPRTPAVTRDLALVLPEGQPLLPVLDLLKAAAGDLLEDARLFDVFRGGTLEAGTKSAAFSLTLRSPEKTLEDAEVAAVMERVVRQAGEAFGAKIRM